MTTLTQLYDYAKHGNIFVYFGNIKFSKAITIKKQDKYNIALDYNTISCEFEEKTVLMHELAHIATGAFYKNNHDIHYKRKMENKADKWLIKLTISKNELEEAIKNGYIEPWELAEIFEVTEEFMRKAMFYYKNGYVH